MFNNNIINNDSIFKNKYFFILCLYLKNKTINSNYITEFLFLGYKYNYLILNMNMLIKNLKSILNIIKQIIKKNGNILFLSTTNNMLNNLIQLNCIKYNLNFLTPIENNPQLNLLKSLKQFPDLVISFDYKANYHFLTKIIYYNVPVICITDYLNRTIINNLFYYLIINNNSLYINILIIFLIFNNIDLNKQYFN